ncbi:protein-disulfide reductase DsbD [Afifella pfennigii]|uniref:protein-disulfide reductase DsbD n=1 Tax=Afifella pfennigii TaxID=209897 RepID=UPI0004798ABC|nr:protein-disulfide reductase DsbD [Afifella pfennigii]
MNILRLLASLLFVLLPLAASAQPSDLLEAEEAFRFSVERGEGGEVVLRWEIAEDYYLYREHLQASDAGSGESLALQSEPGVMEADDANFGPSEVYYSQAVARLGSDAPEKVAVSYQGCKKNSICYPPLTLTVHTESLKVSEPVVGFAVAAAQETAAGEGEAGGFKLAEETLGGGMVGSLLASGGALWVVASFLFFGLLLVFTPCVLPMYPILSATLAREGEALTAWRGFVLSSAYVTAMALAFGMLGVVAAWSGQNLQMVLQSPYAIGAVAVLFVVLATSMFGLFELQLPSAWVSRISGAQAGTRGSIGGAAAMGFVSALIVGPCVTAPLAAALLYIAQTGDVYLGASALFALGLGQGIPLIAFGTLGSRALPRAGVWMVHVKHIFGFVFLGAAVWMVSRIVAPELSLALWAVLLITAAVFVGLADRLTADATAGPRFRKAGGLALSLGGVILAIGAASGGTDPLRPLAHFGTDGAGQEARAQLSFVEADSTAGLAERLASAEGRPTLVYFTADWCVTCKVIERDVLPAAEIVAGLDGFQRVKIDVTSLDEANQELMRDLAVVGPPTMIFFDQQGAELSGSRLVGDVTAKTLKASIARVGS